MSPLVFGKEEDVVDREITGNVVDSTGGDAGGVAGREIVGNEESLFGMGTCGRGGRGSVGSVRGSKSGRS